MHDEYLALRRMTERSVGKYAMERIVGAHAVAFIDVVLGLKNDGGLARLQNEWANAILNQLPAAQDDEGSFLFERTVRKMVERFFKICNATVAAPSKGGGGGDVDQKILDQVTFYTSLTTAQSRRAVLEMTQQLHDYIQCLKQLVSSRPSGPEGPSNVFYMYAVSCMYQANKLGFFLDVELSK
jgi:hypothetical protein